MVYFARINLTNRDLKEESKMTLTYKKATKSDANLLIDIYNSSFYDDYVRYGECPGYGKTKSQMEQSIFKFPKYIIVNNVLYFRHNNTKVLWITKDI